MPRRRRDFSSEPYSTTCGVSRIFDLDPEKVDQFCENLAVSHQEVDMPFRHSSEFRH
jgi:hypothetical protein